MDTFWFTVGMILLFFMVIVGGLNKGKSGKRWWKHANRHRWKWKYEQKKEPTESMPEEEGIGEYEIAEFQAHTSAKPYLMTYTESRFFQGLLARSEELGYLVFTKVRLADLIDIDPKYYRQQKIFYKLVSKHIDFVIADTKGRIIQCIELDDYRHEIENRNDKVKDEIMKACNIKLVRVKVNQEYDYDIILDQDTQAKNSRRINRRPFLPHGNNEIIDGSEEPEDRNQESKQGERFERQAESESSESENSRYQKAANGEK